MDHNLCQTAIAFAKQKSKCSQSVRTIKAYNYMTQVDFPCKQITFVVGGWCNYGCRCPVHHRHVLMPSIVCYHSVIHSYVRSVFLSNGHHPITMCSPWLQIRSHISPDQLPYRWPNVRPQPSALSLALKHVGQPQLLLISCCGRRWPQCRIGG